MTSGWTASFFLRGVQVLDVVDEAAVVAVGDLRGASRRPRRRGRPRSSVSSIVRPLLRKAICWNRVAQRLEVEVDGLEDVRAGPERDRRAGARRSPRPWRAAHRVRRRCSPAGQTWPSRRTSTSSRRGQRVDDGDADAVQAAGDLVAAAAELAAGVQHGQHDLDRRLALGGDDVDRDATAVVDDPDAAVGQQRDVDASWRSRPAPRRPSCRRPRRPGGAGRARRSSRCTCRALADRLEALEHLDLAGVVRRRRCGTRRRTRGPRLVDGQTAAGRVADRASVVSRRTAHCRAQTARDSFGRIPAIGGRGTGLHPIRSERPQIRAVHRPRYAVRRAENWRSAARQPVSVGRTRRGMTPPTRPGGRNGLSRKCRVVPDPAPAASPCASSARPGRPR